MSSDAEERDRELKRLQHNIGKQYEENAREAKAKMERAYKKEYSDEMKATASALAVVMLQQQQGINSKPLTQATTSER